MSDRARAIIENEQVRNAEAQALAPNLDESTGTSWLWALLFGPLYFAVHGFWKQALIVAGASIILIPIYLFWVPWIWGSFTARRPWRERAIHKAKELIVHEEIKERM